MKSQNISQNQKIFETKKSKYILTTRGVGVITYTLLSGGVSPFWGGNRYRTMAKVAFSNHLYIVLYFLIFFLLMLSYLPLYFIVFSYLLLSCPVLSDLFQPWPRSSSSFSIFPDPLLRLHPGPSQLRARVRRGERLHQEAAGAQPLREEHSGQGLTTPLADRQ